MYTSMRLVSNLMLKLFVKAFFTCVVCRGNMFAARLLFQQTCSNDPKVLAYPNDHHALELFCRPGSRF